MNMMVVTTEVLPGYEVQHVIGQVVASLPRTRNAYAEGVKQMRGGRFDPHAPEHLARWRNEAISRLGEEARRQGANAVLGMRFDTREVGTTWMELCAYGTAVVVVPAPTTVVQSPPG
jgi:uncharacterized protein YbjQ (UPF0145 family)